MTKLYRVTATQLVYHECYVEADSENEAWDIARDEDLDWKEFTYGDWELLDIEFQTQAKYSKEKA
jgi:hypothetical protein